MSDFNSSLPIRTETNGDAIIRICDKTTNTQVLAINTLNRAEVDIAQQSIGSIKVSKDNNANTELNPIFVSVGQAVSGGEIHHYYVSPAPVAKTLFDTHTYPVTGGKTLLLKQVIATASGKAKFEVKVGLPGFEATKFVGFTSSSDNNMNYTFSQPIEVAGASNVLVVRTNMDNAAMDLYSTIIGVEI
jgi:hypothetical protein